MTLAIRYASNCRVTVGNRIDAVLEVKKNNFFLKKQLSGIHGSYIHLFAVLKLPCHTHDSPLSICKHFAKGIFLGKEANSENLGSELLLEQ